MLETFKVWRTMEYLCDKCDMPVRITWAEDGVPGRYSHACPKCGKIYHLERIYPYDELVTETFGDV